MYQTLPRMPTEAASNTDSFLFSDPIRADRVVSPDQEQMDVDSSSQVNHLSRSAGTSNSQKA